MVSEAVRRENKVEDSIQQVEMLQSPRCIKSHLPLQLLPEQLWTVKPKAKYHTYLLTYLLHGADSFLSS